jgi:hypothetical protein
MVVFHDESAELNNRHVEEIQVKYSRIACPAYVVTQS